VTEGSSCGQEIHDVFDRLVGPVVGGLEAAVGSVLRIGSMVKAAVGKGTTQALMEEQKQYGDLNTLQGEVVGVTVAVAFQQPVPLELSQIVVELVEAIGFIGEAEGRQDGVVDFLRGPTADLSATMEQDFEKADDARVLAIPRSELPGLFRVSDYSELDVGNRAILVSDQLLVPASND
jgi:hypothetical protein